MSSLSVNIAIISFTILITIITFSFETRTNGKLNSYGWTALIFCIVVLALSIYYTIDKENTDNDRFSYNIKKLDTIIRKADTTFFKIDSTTSLQYSLQDSTRKIDSIVTDQLFAQDRLTKDAKKILDSMNGVSKRTRDIFTTSGNILESSIQQLKNAESSFNPVYPFHLFVSYSLSFKESSISKLIDSLVRLKKHIEENLPNAYKDVSFEMDDKKNITYLSIKDYEVFFNNMKDLYPLDKSFQLGFIKKEDMASLNGIPRFDKSIIVLEALYRKNEINHSAKQKISRIKVDFIKQEISFNVYYTEFYTFAYFDKSNKIFGAKDLLGSYMWIYKVGISNYRINKLSLYLGGQFNWPVYLSMDEDVKGNSRWNNYYIHQMQDLELFPKTSIQDDYKIIYYDSSTQSLGLPFPDGN